MRDFVYDIPTRVYFGRTAESNIGPALKEFGATKVLVHFGGGSAKKSGLIDKVENELRSAGLEFVELGGVAPNPKIGFVSCPETVCMKVHVRLCPYS
ncbi:MAG: iron-containing alcohol dehydrogenase, partial [Oscillospiraceae bacterium]|nr:iron-containing alcohol dehydrogenase [Oscillospiraceae bacterium]